MIGQQRDILIDTTLKNPPAAPQVKQPMEEDKVFKKPAPAVELVVESPQKKESQPPAEVAPAPVATAADLPPIAAAAAPAPPEKKKRVASDKLKTHLAKARARSLEVRRQKAAAKKAAKLPTIPEDQVAPTPPAQPAAPPPMAHPPRAPAATMDYDKIINGVVDRMSFNNEVDDEALRLITEDIRKEESAKARKDYEDRLAELERTKRQVAGKNAAVGILRGNRQPHKVFGGAPARNTNQLRGQSSENPFDKCFW